VADWDVRTAELYRSDPADFVAARNSLAKEAKTAGDAEAAAAIKALRRPSAVASALNRVVGDDPALVDALLEAGKALEAAQARALGGDAADLRPALDRRRAAVHRLASAAAPLLGGRNADAVIATLETASVDPTAADLLRRGVLSRELDPPSGFGLPDTVEATPQRGTASDTNTDTDTDTERRAQERANAEETERAQKAAKRLRDAEVACERARDDLAAAEEGLELAEQRVARARSKLARAEEAVAEAQSA
jgi:hypothetical protein